MNSGSRESVLPAPAAAPATRPGEPLLAVADLSKSFGPTRALQDCSFVVRAGEVHAIVGENGSGKSTLVKILAGVHRPDSGTLEIDGQQLTHFRSPRATLDIGVVAVFQEVLVVGSQTVLENIWLGSDGVFRTRVARAAKRARARAVLEELLAAEQPLDTPVELLPLSVRQVCGIARGLVRDPRLLILDESTSALDVAARDRLFAIVRRLTAAGSSVIFISHRMDEIEEIADRITVLRSGRSVATVERAETSAQELVRLMSGADHLTAGAEPDMPASERVRGAGVLQARSLNLREGATLINFTVAAGEVVGLAGLEGHGQDAFLHALCTGSANGGEVVRLDDAGETVIRSARHAARLGVAYVPRDRRTESLFGTLSIRDNFAAPTLDSDRQFMMLRRSRTDARLAAYRDRLAIKLISPSLPITTLSGGNQQKIVMARWLAENPRVLLLNDPTRGVDLNAKRDLYRLLRELADGGVAVVMLSSEVDELIELMDRVIVFREDSVFTEFDRRELSREVLVASFFGEVRSNAR